MRNNYSEKRVREGRKERNFEERKTTTTNWGLPVVSAQPPPYVGCADYNCHHHWAARWEGMCEWWEKYLRREKGREEGKNRNTTTMDCSCCKLEIPPPLTAAAGKLPPRTATTTVCKRWDSRCTRCSQTYTAWWVVMNYGVSSEGYSY